MALREGSGPEIDAREKAINDFQRVGFQTGAPAGGLVGSMFISWEALTADGGDSMLSAGDG